MQEQIENILIKLKIVEVKSLKGGEMRFNPYNPLSYVVIFTLYIILLIPEVFNFAIKYTKELFYKNPFKW